MPHGDQIGLAPAAGGGGVKSRQQGLDQRFTGLVQRVTAFAGAKTRLDAGPRRRVEDAVPAQWFAGGAGEADATIRRRLPRKTVVLVENTFVGALPGLGSAILGVPEERLVERGDVTPTFGQSGAEGSVGLASRFQIRNEN